MKLLINEQSDLQAFVKGRSYEAVKRIAADLIKRQHESLPTGDDQFAYLRSSLKRDGMIEGIQQLMREIETQAFTQRK